MADIETAEFLIDESLLKSSVERLMFICNFFEMNDDFSMGHSKRLLFICNFFEMNDDCYMGHSKRTIFKKINKYMDNFKEQNF